MKELDLEKHWNTDLEHPDLLRGYIVLVTIEQPQFDNRRYVMPGRLDIDGWSNPESDPVEPLLRPGERVIAWMHKPQPYLGPVK